MNGPSGASATRLRATLVGLLAVVFAAVLAPAASAETVAVSSLNDSGTGSLRDAIAKAGAGATITLPAGQITLSSGPLEITKNVTIAGVATGASVLRQTGPYRVVTIAAAPNVTLERLTVTGGSSIEGAGIDANGELTLQEVLVTANHAGGEGKPGFGGGIQSGHGSLSLINSTLSDNTAGGGGEGGDGFGGGINYDPDGTGQAFTLTLTGSTVSGNVVGGGPEAIGFGGGIDASTGQDGGSITVTLNHSVLSGNIAGARAIGLGGGLLLESGGNKNTLALTVEDSAVTRNMAGGGAVNGQGFGGGIDFDSGGAEVKQTLTAANATIAANSAGGGAKEAAGSGGGVFDGVGGLESTSTAALSYLTVAGNSAGGEGGGSFGGGLNMPTTTTIGSSLIAANAGGNCFTAPTSSGHNIDDGSACGFKGTGDRSGVPALLGPLGEHGGPGETEMPLSGSPAIDAGERASCPATDQRGVARPQGGGCDVGAVEVPPPTASTGALLSTSAESATVGASVNPNFSEATYHFDYGTTTSYGRESANANAGGGGLAQGAAAALGGLKPATSYHYRVVAINAAGTVVGADAVFTTSAKLRAKATMPGRPSLVAVSLTHSRFRVSARSTAVAARRAPAGTAFKFRLTVAATVRITFTRSAAGLRHGRGCVAPTRRLRRARAKRCTRTLTVGALTRAKLAAFAHTIAFSGRIGRHALSPNRYNAVLTASNTGGHSPPVTLRFTVVR